ncbi:MAG: carboxypeptidase-like regulatory domain-containing protein [Bacteroidales bacterium]
MKKSLLLMTVLLLAAVTAQAQAPVTWMANTYCIDSSIAADAVALPAMQEVVVGDITFTALEKAGAGWLYKVTSSPTDFTYNGVTYSASYVQGQTNPLNGRILRDADYPAIAKFSSATNGSLDVTFKFGYNKRFWVAAIQKTALEDLDLSDSLAISAYAYQYAEGATYWSGYFDPTTTPPSYYMGATPTVDPGGTYFTGITLDIKSDHEYFVFFAGSKLMLCGFTYTPTPVITEYSVSGTVKTGDGSPVEGVLVTSSDTKTSSTNASGEYSIPGITEASITLTPSKANYRFDPESITLTMDKDYSDQNFVATLGYSVSGTVKTSTSDPVGGVLVTSSDGKTATTNSSGEYSIAGITEASVTLTPTKTGYTFDPVSITLTMDKDYTGQNFVATPPATTYSVSGTVQTSTATAVEGVLITSSDGSTATTNASGEYSITGITEASITLTPSKTNYTFEPVSITLTMDKDYTAQNFVATFSTGLIENRISNVSVVTTEYYNILGKKLEKPVLGDLNIIVRTFSDGSVKAEKVLLEK